MKIWMVLILGLLLTGCVSTSSGVKFPDQDSKTVEGAVVNVKLATGYMQRGEYEIAMEKLQRALQFDPDYATAHTVIGVLYTRIDEMELAGKHYKRAVELNPNDGSVLNNYGQYLCQVKRYEEAYPYFKRAIDQPFYRTPADAYSNAGRCAIDEGKLDKAEQYLRQALKVSPNYPPTLIEVAQLMALKGEYLKSRAFLERYHSSGQVTAESLYLGYDVERKLGDDSASQEYRSKLIRQFPDSPLTNHIL